MDACAFNGDDVVLADILILEVLGHVVEAVVGPLERRGRAGSVSGKKLELRSIEARLERARAPVILVGDAPVGGEALDSIGGRAIERTRGSGQRIRLALLRGAVAAELRVERFLPERIGCDSRNVLGERAIDLRAGERGDGG